MSNILFSVIYFTAHQKAYMYCEKETEVYVGNGKFLIKFEQEAGVLDLS